MDSLIAAIILGFFGGLMGAMFIIINNTVNHIRKKYLKFKWMKIMETLCLVFLTATVMYIAVFVRYENNDNPDSNSNICYPLKHKDAAS